MKGLRAVSVHHSSVSLPLFWNTAGRCAQVRGTGLELKMCTLCFRLVPARLTCKPWQALQRAHLSFAFDAGQEGQANSWQSSLVKPIPSHSLSQVSVTDLNCKLVLFGPKAAAGADTTCSNSGQLPCKVRDEQCKCCQKGIARHHEQLSVPRR